MDESWDADIEIEQSGTGLFVAVLVFTPPPDVGPSLRVPIEGEYWHPELAEMAALDAFAAMTRG